MTTKKHPKQNIERRRFSFFQIGFIMACAATLVAFEWTTYQPEEKLGIAFTEFNAFEDEMMHQPLKPRPPKQVQEVKMVDMSKPPEIVPVDPPKIKTEPFKDPVIFTDSLMVGFDEEIDTTANYIFETETVRQAEFMPYFKSLINEPAEERTQLTDDMLLRFLQKNVVYPQIAKDAGESGKAYVGYTIDVNGNVVDVVIERTSGSARLDREAIRVVKKLPPYMPGKQGVRSVNVRMVVPINFVLL